MNEKTIRNSGLIAGNNHIEEHESPDKVILDAVPENRKKDVKELTENNVSFATPKLRLRWALTACPPA